MTRETKMKVKMDFYEKSMEQAVQCLMAMDAEVGEGICPNSWEGVMQMLSDVMHHGDSDDRAAAILAASKWSWAFCECAIHKHVANLGAMIAAEVAAASTEDSEADAKPEAEAEVKPEADAKPEAGAEVKPETK